ncbi:MAG: hypothetical protein WDO13_12385 [Verrucomicrobiota bacterium]
MSFAEVLEELPKLTAEQRELILQRVLELEDSPFSAEEEALIEKRMAEHRANPNSAVRPMRCLPACASNSASELAYRFEAPGRSRHCWSCGLV